MKLTLEIDDRNLQKLKEALRVSMEQHKQMVHNLDDPTGLIARIFKARQALDLSLCESDMCYDYVYTPEQVDLILCK